VHAHSDSFVGLLNLQLYKFREDEITVYAGLPPATAIAHPESNHNKIPQTDLLLTARFDHRSNGV